MLQKLKILFFVLISIVILLTIRFQIFRYSVYIAPPSPSNLEILQSERLKIDDHFFMCKNNWLRRSESGLWEMYIEGEAFERGAMKGILSRELVYEQERAFLDEIQKMIPSKIYLRFLKYFVAWFNRNIDTYIPDEFKLEIFGVSEAASDDFSEVGPSYLRFLNYHGAHDIGHSLQNMGMVGCTSFAVWNDASEDSLLIIGRNFDFYVGDDFSKNIIVAFYNPEPGYKFMFVTWGGMIGVVSGMNEKGLTVTINAAQSGIPLEAKTPVSIVAREVLQYASNIEEAYNIINQRETFVSESFFIGSAIDKKAVIIEKSGDKTGIFETGSNTIICANHFQSCDFENDELNLKAIGTSSSPYRQQRVAELINELQPFNYIRAAALLRDRLGIHGKNIGMGNEKAINQLIAHHSIIFIPEKLLVWVSTRPYQLGKYVAYDLSKIFQLNFRTNGNKEIYETELTIPPDDFLFSDEFKQFEEFKKFKHILSEKIKCKQCNKVTDEFIEYFVSLNPEYYLGYSLSGDYYMSKKKYNKAIAYYTTALTKEVTSKNDEEKIKANLAECKRRI